MDEAKKKALELLRSKRDAMNGVLLYTRGVKYTGAESDSQKYVALIRKREEFFERMRELDAGLAGLGEAVSGLREAAELDGEIKEAAAAIVKLDEETGPAVARMAASIKEGIKEIRNGKNLNALYNNAALIGQYSRLDQKK